MANLSNIFSTYLKSDTINIKKEAQKLEEEGRYIEAIDRYIEALNVYPDDKIIYVNLGLLYEKLDKIHESLEMYKSVLLLYPNYITPLEQIKRAVDNNIDISVDFLEELLGKVTSVKQKKLLLSLLGDIYEKQRNYSVAIEKREAFLEFNPRDIECLHKLAELYRICDYHMDRQKKVLEKLFKLDKEDKKVPAELFGIYKRTERKPSKELLDRLAVIYEEERDWPDLVNILETLLADYYLTRQEKLNILKQQGCIYMDHLQEKDRAIIKFEELLKVDKNNPEYHDRLLYLYYATEDYDSTVEKFSALIDRNPLDGSSYFFMSQAFRKYNSPVQSFYSVLIALILQPDSKEYVNALKELIENCKDIENITGVIKSEDIFTESVVEQKEKEFNRLFNCMRPVMEQFYNYEIDKDILLNSSEITPEHMKDEWKNYYDIIFHCSELLLMALPRIYIYKGDNNFNVIISKDDKGNPFLILNDSFREGISENEQYFILGQEISYIKRNNVIYRQIARDLPSFLADYIIDAIISRVPVPIPSKLKKSSFTKVPVEKLIEMAKKATLSNYFIQWGRKITSDPKKANIIENMLAGIDETSDRCGLLCCGNIKDATLALVKNYLNKRNLNDVHIKDLLEKDKKLRERLIKLWKFALGKDFMKLFTIGQ
ncbi:MAG: tetratricopeptide repeat protein [Candidatus Eremiobacterota bacterium]